MVDERKRRETRRRWIGIVDDVSTCTSKSADDREREDLSSETPRSRWLQNKRKHRGHGPWLVCIDDQLTYLLLVMKEELFRS